MEAAVSSTSTCWHLKKVKFVCLSEKTWSPLKKKKKGGVPYVMEKNLSGEDGVHIDQFCFVLNMSCSRSL